MLAAATVPTIIPVLILLTPVVVLFEHAPLVFTHEAMARVMILLALGFVGSATLCSPLATAFHSAGVIWTAGPGTLKEAGRKTTYANTSIAPSRAKDATPAKGSAAV